MAKNKNSRKIDRNKIMDLISRNWPIHVTEVAQGLGLIKGDPIEDKISINLVKYHFDQLAREDKIKVKKIGRCLVAWPTEVEKLRVVHDLIKGL
ncbi:MAG: hypothetical protein OH319_04510 [Candidatus Parvarchaeota archaeon]|nr:hypothetical protein [Candidatus Jingweiarchaeum tengchongense]MCW1297899.1 hypothetical protein [Candidatus Jingweiarchaeum tengchongense]MCW1300667.1 hypothetical protein [Candidatus Jingweiarchaeum tengchongense]MCW1304661.1 hypothetical protein [Candidatus Jingweiarchaeum tengchongense]MCW1305850.1 hypothetical protein [Candidatus Jingweiarchaeum tengchongense]